MDVLHIEKTRSTPEIHFDPAANLLNIKGQSYPENAFKFYEPIFAWVDEYIMQLRDKATVEMYLHMPYINTSSSKCLMMLLEKLEDAHNSGKQITLKWFYDKDNEAALECAEEFKEDLSLPFEIIEVEEEFA
ncbi:MAG: DUF1987 domain-containing protein [Negativicutes bacterium]|nr:DUF1987 domain-containing protein [Negativicutes bacterium]